MLAHRHRLLFFTVITHYTLWYSLVRWSVGSDCFLTTTEPLQSSFSIDPRPPRSGDLGPIVLVRIRAQLPRSHMPKRTGLRGETCQVPKQQARCESALKLTFKLIETYSSSDWRYDGSVNEATPLYYPQTTHFLWWGTNSYVSTTLTSISSQKAKEIWRTEVVKLKFDTPSSCEHAPLTFPSKNTQI